MHGSLLTSEPVRAAPQVVRNDVARRPMPRRRDVVGVMASLDVFGLVVAYSATAAVTRAWPDTRTWAILALLVPFGMHLGRCYAVDNSRTTALAAVRAAVAASAAVAVAAGIVRLGALAPVAPWFVAWPTVVRAATTAFLRARAHRVRWLVLGSADCLTQLWHDKAVSLQTGDMVMLSRDGSVGDVPISGGWETLDRWLTRSWAGIIVANNESLPEAVLQRLMRARLQGCRVITLSDFYERYWSKVPIFHLHDGWFAMAPGFDLLHDPNGLRLKRAMDIACALLLSLVSLPCLFVIALAVKLTSRGPVLFKQERVGCGGRTFTLLKFRTMRVGSETGDRYTQQGDARITSIGRLLRKTRLDEFPQLWNVLRGDMSFIGPRAEWTRCVTDYEREIPFYQLRHLVKPGLTGWAQVNYPYGASIEDAREKLQYDFYYIKNHSLWLDLVILVKTVRVVLFGLGGR